MANPYIPEAERVKNAELLDQVRQLVLVPLSEMFTLILDGLAPSLMGMAGQPGPSQLDYGAAQPARRIQQAVLG